MNLFHRVSQVANAHGNTRVASVMRIALACLLWVKWAGPMRLFTGVGREQPWLAVAFWVATTCMLVGLFSRLACFASGIVGLVLFYWLGMAEGQSQWIHHHTYLMCVAVLVLGFACPGGSLSVDRWRLVQSARSRGESPPPEWGAQLGLTLIGLQVSAVYFWGAVNKLQAEWMTGETLEWVVAAWYFGSDMPDIPGFHAAMIVANALVVVIEFALAIGLWFPRFHRVLFPLGLLLHAGMYYLLPVSIFSFLMAVLYLAYVPPGRFQQAMDDLMGGT